MEQPMKKLTCRVLVLEHILTCPVEWAGDPDKDDRTYGRRPIPIKPTVVAGE